jgi:hypothetical protein
LPFEAIFSRDWKKLRRFPTARFREETLRRNEDAHWAELQADNSLSPTEDEIYLNNGTGLQPHPCCAP